MGVVYQAEDIRLGRRVAMKFLPGEVIIDRVAFDRLQREARAASALDHPNICSIYELDEHAGQPFIVMQLLEGQTLRAWIEGVPKKNYRSRLGATLDLRFRWQTGWRRPIKRASFIETSSLRMYLSPARGRQDSGFRSGQSARRTHGGRIVSRDHGRPTRPRSAVEGAGLHLTLTGSTMGTASYMSPEQVRGEKLDARTDLFSLGLVLYEMVTGQKAFAGETGASNS